MRKVEFLSHLQVVHSKRLILRLPIRDLYAVSIVDDLANVQVSGVYMEESVAMRGQSLSSVRAVQPILFVQEGCYDEL